MILTEQELKDYWKHRAQKNKERSVGFRNRPLDKQKLEYVEKKKFIFKYCPKSYITLDYGCGVGRYAGEFSNYLGVDITKELLDIAKKQHPKKDFLLLQELCLPEKLEFDFELFLTATVLQHNPDDVVKKIFESVAKLKPSNILFCLYENSQVVTHHVQARNSEDYVALVSNYFEIKGYASYKHKVHNEEHILTLIRV